jgi:hypothetical protein
LLGSADEVLEWAATSDNGEHEAAEWQATMEALILVATSGGPTMLRASA